MPRLLRRLLVIVALVGAWALIGKHHAPLPLTLNEASAGSLPRAKVADSNPKDLSQLRIFNKVVLYVKDNYVDPRRVKPKDMMIQALEYVEKTVPEVMVEGTPESGQLKVTAGNNVRTWDISQVDSLWKMSFTIHDVMGFIGENMRPVDDIHDVEYAAINGMLSTLDPHSVLLTPNVYRDLQASTKGEFGGLGFVIQMREGNLTVHKVLPKTPAWRAGIKKDDRIMKIGEESTINMDLNDAVSKLRGPVDTPVTITVARDGWDKPHQMTLNRAQIALDSVLHKLLANNVGYIRLKNFQGNTTHDMQEALDDLEKRTASTGGLKGLVLDLRGNPGGLLDQAVQVSDTFVSHGTIVSTVGYSDKMRDEKHATADDSDVKYPMAVLVNSGSASASEIVAGALKNLDRATIIGQQTFGKGSVQMLYEFPDDSALKLTIAKYLTPGDVSIQEIGIEPDIALVPTRVTEDRVNVFAPRKTMGEADLSHHFANPDEKTAAKSREDVVGKQKPLEEVRYLKETAKTEQLAKAEKNPNKTPPKKGAAKTAPKDAKNASAASGAAGPHDALLDADANEIDDTLYDQLDADTVDDVKEDFEIDFARDFVLHAPSMDRKQQLTEAKSFVEQKKGEEQERINKAIAQLGVNWTAGQRPANVALTATVKPGAEKHLVAGEELDLEVTAENHGKQPLERVRAWTDSDDPWLDRREFLFGKIGPGEKRTWKVPIKLPKDLTTRREDLTVKFFDDQGALPTQVVSELDFVELPRPAFAMDWQVIDDCQTCNGDGVANRGEHVKLLIDVTNTGKGKALDSYVSMRNGADANIFIDQGRFKLGELAPGETKTATLSLEVKPGFSQKSFDLKTAVIDEPLEEFSSEKITLPVGDKAQPVVAKNGFVKVQDGAQLFASAAGEKTIAQLPKGAVLQELGQVGKLDKVSYGENGRFAFVDTSAARELGSAKPSVHDVKVDPFRIPPAITTNVDTTQGGIVANGDKFSLNGTAVDPKGLMDLYVLVNDQKVFFKTADPNQAAPTEMAFSANFPLKEGNNFVMVVARQTEEFSSKKMLVIRRRPNAIAQALAHEHDQMQASTAPAPSSTTTR